MNIDIWTALKLAGVFAIAIGFAWAAWWAVMPRRPEEPTKEELEEEARAIYESWSSSPKYKPWVVGGNSQMQDHARYLARKNLEVVE